MRSYYGLFMAGILTIGISGAAFVHADEDEAGYEYMAETLKNTKAMTLGVIEAMPEERYTYKPTDEVRTFGAQAFHLAASVDFFLANFKGEQFRGSQMDENSMSKDEIVQYYSEQFDKITDFIMEAEESGQMTAGIMFFIDHNANHRGQMVTYLRLNDITPPQSQ